MDKDTCVKAGAIAFALMMFVKTNGAASASKQALAENKIANDKITALEERIGAGVTASGEATTDEAAAEKPAKSNTGSVTAAKKTTTTVAKSMTTAKAATGAHGATGATGAIPLHWSYEGDTGPAHWSALDKAYEACLEGSKQSPIDISNARVANLPDLAFNYAPITGSVVNNGHTIQVDVTPGDTMTAKGITYGLAQFHFHGPSEHTVGGKAYPLEVHLVHKDPSGKLAEVGVLISEGEENAAFKDVIDNLPTEENKPKTIVAPIDPKAMIPAIQATYRYDGSLTTPPCSEGVDWNVMAQPVTMSKAQIAAITAKFHEPNNRPIQKLGSRELLLDVSVSVG